MPSSGRVHDRAILDALDAIGPVAFAGTVWRIVRAGRNPTQGSSAQGRWSPGGSVEVLYAGLEKEGALAEIGYRLGLEPVWPSRIEHDIVSISATGERCLRFADTASLAGLGIDTSRYESLDYSATQALAAAAHFLEFDGLLVPSARHDSTNLVVFMDRPISAALQIVSREIVDWASWRRRRSRRD